MSSTPVTEREWATGDLVGVEYMGERVSTYLLATPKDGEAVLWMGRERGPMSFAVSSLLEPTEAEKRAAWEAWAGK